MDGFPAHVLTGMDRGFPCDDRALNHWLLRLVAREGHRPSHHHIVAIGLDHVLVFLRVSLVLRGHDRVAQQFALRHKVVDSVRVALDLAEYRSVWCQRIHQAVIGVTGMTQRLRILGNRKHAHLAKVRAGGTHDICRSHVVDDLVTTGGNALHQACRTKCVEGLTAESIFVGHQLCMSSSERMAGNLHIRSIVTIFRISIGSI